MTGDFDGLVAVVTGGAAGIGAATAQLLMTRGAQVASLDRTEIAPDGTLAVACDVTDRPLAGSTTGAVLHVDGGMTTLRI